MPKCVRYLHISARSKFLEKIDAGSFNGGITESVLNVTIYYSKKIVINIATIFRSFLNKFVSFIKVFKNFQLLSL